MCTSMMSMLFSVKQFLPDAKVLDPVKDQFWGDRHGRLEDPFGHLWSIATHKKDLSEDEMKSAAEAAFSQMSK